MLDFTRFKRECQRDRCQRPSRKHLVEKIKVNEAGSIGVIAEDENACYSATLIKKKTDAGAQKVLVALQANAVVRTKAIIVRRQTVYQNPDTIKAVLPKFKSDVAAFVAANPEVMLSCASPVLGKQFCCFRLPIPLLAPFGPADPRSEHRL